MSRDLGPAVKFPPPIAMLLIIGTAAVLHYFGYQMMAGFFLADLWAFSLLPITYGYLRYYVIAKEEAYLQQQFGEGYRQYQQQVRRWL